MRGQVTGLRRTAAFLSAAAVAAAFASPVAARADIIVDPPWWDSVYDDSSSGDDPFADAPVELDPSDSHDGVGDAWDRLGIAGQRPVTGGADDGEAEGKSEIVQRVDRQEGAEPLSGSPQVATVVIATTGMAAAVGLSLVTYRMSHDDRYDAKQEPAAARS